MRKPIFILAAALSMTACAQNKQSEEPKTLVVYFSATGNTREAAKQIAAEHQAALWEIEAAEPYSAADLDWRNAQSRSSIEMNDPQARPAIKQCTNIQPYDTLYVGYPIWWGICPRIIDSWVENNIFQLEGKVLIPFATSGSSGVEKSVEYLRTNYPSLNWKDGILMNY